jgi:uncharacterized protein (TIGR02145 family)
MKSLKFKLMILLVAISFVTCKKEKKEEESKSLTISQTTINAEQVAGNVTITVISNTSWSISSNQEWCNVDNQSGTNNGTITVSWKDNLGLNQRSALITVSGVGVINQTITVTQQPIFVTGDIINLQNQGTLVGSYINGYLDGVTGDGTVHLITDILSGANWYVTFSDKDIITLRCKGTGGGTYTNGCLDASTASGAVYLNTSQTSGTFWKLTVVEKNIINLQCMGTGGGVYNNGYLDGSTESGTVYLNTSQPTGTRWKVSKGSTGGGETVTDVDGNVYHTITIGSQVWMLENLKTTKYRNGDPITNITSNSEWEEMKTEAFCVYNNDPSNNNTYGLLYNWYAVMDPRNIAPPGWHVPSIEEWTNLVNYLGGKDHAGGKMKEEGTSHWKSPNEGATNSSGFTALPGGQRDWSYGEFMYISQSGYWWSTTDWGLGLAYMIEIDYIWDTVFIDWLYYCEGYSVRCVKD